VKRIAIAGAALLVLAGAACSSPRTTGSRAKPRNVLFITMDTTRADRIGAYGCKTVATPTLDALAADGIRFARSVTSIPLTLPAHSSLMTGTNPMHHRVRDNGGFFLGDDQKTLAEILSENGFATGAVVGSFVLNRHWGLNQGFASYDDEFGPADPREASDLHQQRDGAEVADHGIKWLEKNSAQRFFLWLHFYDPHYPYEPKGRFAKEYEGRPYDGEIAYTDSLVGSVVRYLKEHKLYDDTLIVVAGDHGEGLGDHGEPDHGIYLYDSTLHVPLIVRVPGGPRGAVVEALSRDIDVTPTVLDLLGIPAPPTALGRTLMPLVAGEKESPERSAYSESFYVRYHYGWKEPVSLRTRRYKFIDLPHAELYDLENDPGERNNLAELHPERAADMKRELEKLRGEAGSGAEVQQPEKMDAETVARLQSLGYLGSPPVQASGDLPDPKDKADVLDVLIRASRATGESMKSGRTAEGIATVKKAIELEPNFMDGYQFLGTLYLQTQQPDLAIAALDKVLKFNGDSIAARQLLARCYLLKNDPKTALALVDWIVAHAPRFVGSYYTAADILADRGDYGGAIARLRGLLKEYPDAVLAEYEIGKILLRAGRLPEARAQILKSLEHRSSIRSAHFNLALIAEQEGDADTAAHEYAKELELFPDNFEALTNVGILHMQQAQPEQGIAAFRKLVELRPDDSTGYYLLARAYLSVGRADGEVVGLARKAVELDPRNDRARRLLSELHARAG
jgi:arylsulfatase A-like enzyme/Tfp pilus assembly protein PilF